MVGLNGQDYDGRKLKIEYGTLQDKPHYDKRAPKVVKMLIEDRFKSFFCRQSFTSLICLIALWITLKSCGKSLICMDLLKKRK